MSGSEFLYAGGEARTKEVVADDEAGIARELGLYVIAFPVWRSRREMETGVDRAGERCAGHAKYITPRKTTAAHTV